MRHIQFSVIVVAVVVAVAAATPLAAGGPADGFIYGKVTTASGASYEGFMRWGDEEAFWGDLFNSTKENRQWTKNVPRRERQRRRPLEVFGIRLGLRWDDLDPSRVFVARFGDIARIEVVGSEDAVITLKSGTSVEVSGGANDVEAEITIHDRAVGEIQVPWKKIDTVEFFPAPEDAKPSATRLWGRLQTSRDRFEGFIQWDSEECLSTDILDGDSEDGRLKVEMGQIKAIERRSRRSSRVELADGRNLTLSGTNDVDESIRGIMVEDSRFGRVEVPWDAFERLEFVPPPGSGPGYAAFASGTPLSGVVTDERGQERRGRIVFDLDEAETWEILHGTASDVEYVIPFSLVAAIEPRGRAGSQVTLRSGQTLRLEDSQDVGEDNAGVLVFTHGEQEPTFVPWDEVRRIAFQE